MFLHAWVHHRCIGEVKNQKEKKTVLKLADIQLGDYYK